MVLFGPRFLSSKSVGSSASHNTTIGLGVCKCEQLNGNAISNWCFCTIATHASVRSCLLVYFKVAYELAYGTANGNR